MFDPIILHIDTATEVCSVTISRGKEILHTVETAEPNQHASKLTLFIQEAFQQGGIHKEQLHAVAVSMGPGSYTGLRIGVSTAKGLCYGLGIPLIGINTLESMFEGYRRTNPLHENSLYWPMIDARRMEVYTATWNTAGQLLHPTSAEIIDDTSFDQYKDQQVFLFGSGAGKFENTFADKEHIHIVSDFRHSSRSMCTLALQRFMDNSFEDLVYFEPFYLKEFIATTPRKTI